MALKPQASRRQHAFVLIAVLWMVAALSILVAGMSQSVRNEIRVASTTRQAATGNATGDAAIALVLQEIGVQQQTPSRMTYVSTTYHDAVIQVQVMPLTGLIDINNAPVQILASLLSVAGGMAASEAQRLADSLVEMRSRRDQRGALIGFEATEDLLRVPAISYDLYAKISPLLTADLGGNGKVNPLASPESVLAVLANGNLGAAAKLAADRDSGEPTVNTTGLDAAYIESGATNKIRCVARVPLAEGAFLIVSRDVDLKDGAPDGLPWRTLQATYRFDPGPLSRN